jgi:hypothetical protein
MSCRDGFTADETFQSVIVRRTTVQGTLETSDHQAERTKEL